MRSPISFDPSRHLPWDDEPERCEICHYGYDDCTCPECPVCHETVQPSCINTHIPADNIPHFSFTLSRREYEAEAESEKHMFADLEDPDVARKILADFEQEDQDIQNMEQNADDILEQMIDGILDLGADFITEAQLTVDEQQKLSEYRELYSNHPRDIAEKLARKQLLNEIVEQKRSRR